MASRGRGDGHHGYVDRFRDRPVRPIDPLDRAQSLTLPESASDRGRPVHGSKPQGRSPDTPARSRWDFVIRSADAAMWVSGARPKGKGFDFALDARIDTSRWLEVSGVVKRRPGLAVARGGR